MKEPYPSQKYHVLMKLKMTRSGQGWRRLKTLLTLLSAKIRSRGSSRQTFGATELRSPIINTSRSLMNIANMAPACQESGLTQGLSAPVSSSLRLLVPPSFSSSPPSSSEEGSPLNMGATGAEFRRTLETGLKRHLTVYLSYCCCCLLFFLIVFVACFLCRLV